MAKQIIGIGTVANDGTGDTLRAGMDKVNDNFTECYNAAVEPAYFYWANRNFRMGERDSKLCIDQVLTPQGFDVGGVENVNWQKVGEFAIV